MLADVVLRVAAMEYAEEESKPYYPRPSIAGPERCLRQMVYWAHGKEQKPLSGRAIVVFSDSAWQEELSMDLLRKSAFQVHSEQMGVTLDNVLPWMPSGTWTCSRCTKEIPHTSLHGHHDFMVTDILGVDRLVEHKALSFMGFDRIWKGELPIDYLCQTAIYLCGLQQDNPDLTEGILLIKNKNQSGYMEIRCSYDMLSDTLSVIERVHHTGERKAINLDIPRITASIFEKFRKVDEHIKNGTIPDRQYEKDSWRCEYCPYGTLCWSTWVEEHEQLTADVVLEGEIVDLIAYERECARQERDIKKERDKLRAAIKKILKAGGVREGRAGDYVIDWQVSKQRKLDVTKLPAAEYQAALVEEPGEKLTIKRVGVE